MDLNPSVDCFLHFLSHLCFVHTLAYFADNVFAAFPHAVSFRSTDLRTRPLMSQYQSCGREGSIQGKECWSLMRKDSCWFSNCGSVDCLHAYLYMSICLSVYLSYLGVSFLLTCFHACLFYFCVSCGTVSFAFCTCRVVMTPHLLLPPL